MRQGLACGAVSSLDGVVGATFVGDGRSQSGSGWLQRAASRLVPFVAAVYMFAACSPSATPSPVPASTPTPGLTATATYAPVSPTPAFTPSASSYGKWKKFK